MADEVRFNGVVQATVTVRFAINAVGPDERFEDVRRRLCHEVEEHLKGRLVDYPQMTLAGISEVEVFDLQGRWFKPERKPPPSVPKVSDGPKSIVGG